MKSALIYYPRLDASFVISCNDYTDLVRILTEFRGCIVHDIIETESIKEFDDED